MVDKESFGGGEMDYEMKVSSRARRITISVHPDGRVVVTRPVRASLISAQRFLISQKEWVWKRLEKFSRTPTPKYNPGGTKADYEVRKKEARRFVVERLKQFNEFYNFKYGRISIRNQTTRWGSCSIDGNLSFNYKIVTLPIRIADYIIVHELCHTKEFNHSEKFWALVERAIPEYAKIRKQLRGQGMEIE